MRHTVILIVLLLRAVPAIAQAPQAYVLAGSAAYRNKEYAKCAAIFGAAMRTEPPMATGPPMGAARCHAAGGELTRARRYVDLSLTRGYRSCAVLGNDVAMTPLHGTAWWKRTVDRCHANEDRFYESLNAEVFAAMLSDQADRAGDEADIQAILTRDATRRRLVQLSIRSRSLKTAADYFDAALIMQHGSEAGDYQQARDLARHAADLDPTFAPALWLYAAATDRLLQHTGHPQIYGTQYKQVDHRWTLEPLDVHAVTDAERARWRVESLGERLSFIENLNGHP